MTRSSLRRCALILILALPLSSLAAERSIDEFFDRFTADWVRGNPDLATSLRYFSGEEQDRLERQLTPLTRAYQEERTRLARRGLEELRKFDRTKLDDTRRLSAELMDWLLEAVVRAEPYRDFHFPLQQFSGANVDLIETFTLRHPLVTPKDADNFVARLALMDDRMNEAVAEAKRLADRNLLPPKFIVQATLASMHTFADAPVQNNPLVTVFAQKTASIEGLPADKRAALQQRVGELVQKEIYPAWQKAIALLDAIGPRTTDDAGLWRFKGGDAAYANSLLRFTTTDLTPGEIHEIGLKQVATIEARMDEILKSLGRTQGAVRERMAKLEDDLRYPDPTSDAARTQIMSDIDGYMKDAIARSIPMFERTPKTPVIAQPFPRFREASAAANYNRAPPDGSRPAIFQMPLRVQRMTRLGLRTLVYHETVPGHHFQIALEQENPDLPRFRQARALGGISAMSEGWALYAEKLAAESGWYEGDPEGLLGQLSAELFRARRLVVDTGLHSKKWTRQQAIDFGIEGSEVDRYVVYPGQACSYMIGQLRILEMRDRARAELGDRFSLRGFHSAVLNTGTMPLGALEREVERYVDVVKGK
ncbi:MAG TPA: DUF885 family protein [Povalibacter sp.]|uniref:DUF885 domain-containing protein n=1 Tax=Povalibacter sp. TaxID=1962978 RepID=UPI002B543E9F|nr:DUF885 family protein [Povalibacter sp.]HMN46294.1 DUF885 family protein [Povalibacter sp.]